ncbi:hypothetical protein Mal64_35620 [Pseudobythopirellula maris]|uniref:VWFA domain-containing protein n=1 Tax=Pseudobythopirellula maris TaxID=2527991 RepID=A0A5C5ZJU9_9BACT|nr:hypothetical protein [Pseudobythopirellula maris]TWT86733.1 hypothetical protein Mal64_35620 [Pseudobythopirellula maris]
MNPRKSRRRNVASRVFIDLVLQVLALFLITTQSEQVRVASLERQAGLVPGLRTQVERLGDQVGGYRTKVEKQGVVIQQMGERIGAYRGKIDKQGLVIASQGKALGGYKSLVTDLRSKIPNDAPVTLLIVVDETWSMAAPHREIVSGTKTLCAFMSSRSESFRFGAISFRQGVSKQLPIMEILPTSEDEGASELKAMQFLATLKVERSNTDHGPVLREAIRVLEADARRDPQRKFRLVFVGDVGPAELDGAAGYSRQEKLVKQELLGLVRRWAQRGDRAVASLYAESDWTKSDPASAESRAWFKALGSVSEGSSFTTDTGELQRTIFNAVRR